MSNNWVASNVWMLKLQLMYNYNMTVFVFPPAEDEGSESGNFVTNEDPSQKLKWQAHLEFTQNQELGELTWDKVSKFVIKCFNLQATLGRQNKK